MWYFWKCLSWEDDITGFPDCDDFICERFARCKFDITLEHDIMVLSLRKRIILLKITMASFPKNSNVLLDMNCFGFKLLHLKYIEIDILIHLSLLRKQVMWQPCSRLDRENLITCWKVTLIYFKLFEKFPLIQFGH